MHHRCLRHVMGSARIMNERHEGDYFTPLIIPLLQVYLNFIMST